LRVAALGPKTGNEDAFLEALQDADAAIRSLSNWRSRLSCSLSSLGYSKFSINEQNAAFR
jgi:hypothetical protein